jgi:beta-lactamase family protein
VLAFVVLHATTAHADGIDDFLRAEMHQRRIPGLAPAVVRHGAVMKLDGYGPANLEHDVPVTPDTVFELASVTKPITAAAVMALVEDGKIHLDAPITTYLRGAPDTWRNVTTRHLLTHTSGLPTPESDFAGAGMEDIRLRYRRGITGTEVSLFPDDGLMVVVLTNLGRQVGGTDPVNAWGLTSAVAERYLARYRNRHRAEAERSTPRRRLNTRSAAAPRAVGG